MTFITESCRKLMPLYYIVSRSVLSNLTVTFCKPHNVSSLNNQSHYNLLKPACSRCYCTQTENNNESEVDDLYRQVTIEVKGHDPAVIKSYVHFAVTAAAELDIKVNNILAPPKTIDKWTLLKSVHIYKKHRVQYETRTHFKIIELKHLTGSTADTYLEYIQRNLPEGMAMKVTKHRLETLPDHLLELQ